MLEFIHSLSTLTTSTILCNFTYCVFFRITTSTDEIMIREKIFRLHKHKSSSSSFSANKFDFTFSNIHLIQVPKGWDKLCVSISIISSETEIESESRKSIHKSAKASVKNGSCKWTETLSESIWIPDHDHHNNLDPSSNQYLIKFHVAMGSSRSSVLGQTTLNLAPFFTSKSPTLVSLPLKKCRYGTILQVEVRCLTPKPNLRVDDNMETLSDSTLITNTPQQPYSRETSFSRYSFDSIEEDSVESQSFPRQDSIESNDSSIKSLRSFHGRNQTEDLRKFSHQNDAKVQELEAEARMWEQNARKLADDLETLRTELSDESLNVTNLNAELDTSRSECQKSSREIEHLRSLLEETSVIQNSEIVETLRSDMQREFEDELRFEKEINEDLSLQLQKTQESNIELLSILQEMEETIRKQNIEVQRLSAHKLQSEILVLENTLQDKVIETEIEQDLKNRILKAYVVECSRRLDDISTAFKEEETDKRLSELEGENIYLLQRVSGLEAQLRYLNDTKESVLMELHRSESEIKRFEQEVKSQKLDLTHKLLQMEKRHSEAEEECKTLRSLNIRLEATTESILEEYNLLQNLNGILKEQKLNLQKQCRFLEEEVRRFQDPKQDKKSRVETTYDELEMKVKALEVEKVKLSEENCFLSVQLQKVPELQNEVLALRVSLKEVKIQNKAMEALYKTMSEDYDELKRIKVAVVEKVVNMQKAVSEAKDDRCKKNSLEDKILRLEGDLIAKDALYVEEAEMKHEFNQMKIMNGQVMMKVRHLENVREELWRRVQCLEEELKQATYAEKSLTKEIISKEDNDHPPRSQVVESRTQLVVKANDMYKSQIESGEDAEIMTSAKSECKIRELEDELQDIRERYLEISLKYAQVEAQKEQLVMKLKAVKSN